MRDQDRKLLSTYRLRNWLKVFEQNRDEAVGLQARLVEAGHASGYACLEAREEFEFLVKAGMSPDEIRVMLTSLGVSETTFKQAISGGEEKKEDDGN